MTELTNTPERQSRDPTDSPDAGNVRPNPESHRTRRWRWYLLAVIPVIPVILLTLAVSRIFSGGRCITVGIEPEPSFGRDLRPGALPRPRGEGGTRSWLRAELLLINDRRAWPGPDSRAGFLSDWRPEGTRVVHVFDPSLTSEPITVRVTMTDEGGNTIFDSSARVQPEYGFATYEIPPCYPDAYEARVEAQSTGRLEPRRFH
jgi:hypothetical protein